MLAMVSPIITLNRSPSKQPPLELSGQEGLFAYWQEKRGLVAESVQMKTPPTPFFSETNSTIRPWPNEWISSFLAFRGRQMVWKEPIRVALFLLSSVFHSKLFYCLNSPSCSLDQKRQMSNCKCFVVVVVVLDVVPLEDKQILMIKKNTPSNL